MLLAENVVKNYEVGSEFVYALKNVTINVESGEFTAIMGPSGSGKSTFMNILGCLDRMTSGKYMIRGKDVSTLSDDELAHVRNKEIGFVFQSFNLLPRISVLENVELPMVYAGVSAKERRERAISALVKVQLEDRQHHRPNEISGGQKQRVAIARAIVNNPAIVMADEPTGNLDSVVSEEIMRIFQRLNEEGTTILMVTHEMDIAKHTKRIIRFRDGIVVNDEIVNDRIIL